MQLFVKWEALPTITREDDVRRLRERFGAQLQMMLASGRVIAGGAFTDARSGFFVLEVDRAEDLLQLFGAPVLDQFHLETHPVMPLDELTEFFARQVGA